MKTNKLLLATILIYLIFTSIIFAQTNSNTVGTKSHSPSNTLIENVLLGKNNYAVDPKEVIDNKEFTRRIKQIITSKSPNYIIEKYEDLTTVKPKNSKNEFTYSKHWGMVIGYTYYLNKEYESVQKELAKLNVEFVEGTNNGFLAGNSCVSVSIESENNLVKVDYGYQCD